MENVHYANTSTCTIATATAGINAHIVDTILLFLSRNAALILSLQGLLVGTQKQNSLNWQENINFNKEILTICKLKNAKTPPCEAVFF